MQAINRTLQGLTLRELNEVFDEFDLCNTLVQNLNLVASKLLEVKSEAVAVTIACAKLVGKD